MTIKTLMEGYAKRAKEEYAKAKEGYKPNELQKHISKTYRDMRIGAALLAFALPLGLWLFGRYQFNIELQESMSAYYHTPMRNFFVGALFIVGTFLFIYRGFSFIENQMLNAAGILAILAALIPTSAECALQYINCKGVSITPYTNAKVHGFCAVLFFGCIAWASVFESRHSLKLHNDIYKKWFKVTYWILGVSMIVLPIIVAFFSRAADAPRSDGREIWVFWVEFSAVWVFGLYWAVKTWEIIRNDVDLKVAKAGVSSS